MTTLPVSVVVVSRQRPDALIRCLTGIFQQLYDPFEVVVVACPAGVDAVRRWPPGVDIKVVAFDEPNISAARNLGIEMAAGELLAFIDDDAVPESGWLSHLAAAFGDPLVGAAGGYVRGRNGISWQWRAQSVDLCGQTRALQMGGDRTVRLTPSPGRAIKTEGTNMALRRSVAARLGGFDPNYRFFLDETDLNLRLAALGANTAVVPRAVVHHGFAANAQRRQDRVPRDLTQIGASWAVFLKRHCPVDRRGETWATIQQVERTRALRAMVAGQIEPRDVARLMRSLKVGFAEGELREDSPLDPLGPPLEPFRPVKRAQDLQQVTLKGRVWSRKTLQRAAEESARAGRIPIVYVLSPTALYHRIEYHPEGYWLHRGGLFGKSDRADRPFRLWRFGKRVEREETLWSSGRTPATGSAADRRP